MDSQQAWDTFRARFDEIEPQFVRGLNELVGRFNVAKRSNRFVIGDVVEYLMAATLYSLDILTLPRGGNQDDFDLDALVDALRVRFSIKSSFSRSRPAIGLKNKQGDAAWVWTEPTIFVIQGIGIVYADPTVHTELAGQVKDAKDAYKLSIAAIQRHAVANAHCLIATPIPVNPGTGQESPGRSVFLEIFDHPAYPTIGRFMARAHMVAEGVPIFDALDDARHRRERGDLTGDQYELLVNRLIEQARPR